MDCIEKIETSNNSQSTERTASFDSNCELEYCYDDLSLKFDISPTKWKNNTYFPRKSTLPDCFKDDFVDGDFKMDLDAEIVELFDQDLDFFLEPLLIPEVLDLTNNYFIDTSTPTDDLMDFRINDFVCVGDKKFGYVRFKGRVHFAEGLFCGIELLDRDGKHDGKIDNIRYFKCEANHGLFAPIDKVKFYPKSSHHRPKLEKIRFADQYSIDYNSDNIFQPIKLSKKFHTNNESLGTRVKKIKRDNSTKEPLKEPKSANMMTNKLSTQKSGSYQMGITKENSIQNQHCSNQKSSLLNKLSQQFKLKFNSASVAKNESAESEKRKTLDANQLASSIDQSKKSKLKAPLSFKQTQASKLQLAEKNQSRPQSESKLPGTSKLVNPTLIVKSQLTKNQSKITNLDDFINDSASLKQNASKNPNSTGHTSSDSSTCTNIKLEDNMFSSSSNFVSSASSISSTSSPSRLKQNSQTKRLSAAPEVKSRASVIPGVNRVTSIPSSSNQNKLLRLASTQNSSNKHLDSNFSSSTPKPLENNKNEQTSASLNLMKQSSLNKNPTSIYSNRLSHPVKLGFNHSNTHVHNAQLNQNSNIPFTKSTNNELATKPPKLSLSYKRLSIPSQQTNSASQIAFSKNSFDLSKTEPKPNKIQMNKTFDIEDQADEKIQPEAQITNGLKDEKQKRHGLLLFDSTNNLASGLNDDFLENELIPDDLMDDIHLNNVTAPNKNWLNSSFLTGTTNTFSKKPRLDSNFKCSKPNLIKTKSASSFNLAEPKPESSVKTKNSTTDSFVQSDQIQIENEVKSAVENLLLNVCQMNEVTINSSNGQAAYFPSAELTKQPNVNASEPIRQKDSIAVNFENEMEVVLVEIREQSNGQTERGNYTSDKLDNDQNLMIIDSEIYAKFQQETSELNEDEKLASNSMNKTFDKTEFSNSSFNIKVNSTVNTFESIIEDHKMSRVSNAASDKGKPMTKTTGMSTPATNRAHNTITLAKNSIQKKLETKYTNNTTKNHESLHQIKDLAKKNAESSLTNQSNSIHKSQFIKKTTNTVSQKIVKKLKSLPNAESTNKIEEDQNSVFDTDNHSCSDEESKSSKASSRTGSLRVTSDLRKKTAVNQSTTTQNSTKKPKVQLSSLARKTESIKNNNKENSIPKNLALAKIYKSHEGMTAVSSNTSIMSEVSNLSKTSLSTSKNLSSVSVKLTNQTNSSKQNSISSKSEVKTTSNRLNSASTKQFQNVSTTSRAQANFSQNSDLRKLSIQNDAKSNSLKKTSSEAKKDTITIHTNFSHVRAESILSSPSSSISSARSKTDTKHAKEVKRLEALCEERTKEFSLLKMKHKELLTSFEAVTVAFNYLANDMNGFEVTKLRNRLNLDKNNYESQIKYLNSSMDEKQKEIDHLKTEIDQMTKESIEIKKSYEQKLIEIEEDYKTELKILNIDYDLGVKNLKQENDAKISRLNKTIDTMKIEHEKLVYELREEISKKNKENSDLDARIKECEEALSKDKDERITRLLDIQHTLEKEIESLKAALDIKNLDLFDLRTKNNKLVTQCDNYNEMNMKLRRYKQEVEELKAILQSKQEAERRASENNRLLSIKIEKKDKENQRLSMQNEELQFRLQSQPNLNQLNNDTLNSESDQSSDKSYENFPKFKLTRSSTVDYHPNCKSMDTNIIQTSLSTLTHDNQITNSGVKLRSKSFKANSNRNNKMFSSYHPAQFRPVSENFDFSINERDIYMTRSAVMYSSNDANYLNRDNEYDTLVTGAGDMTAECVSSNDGCDSTSSSNSHLEKNSENETYSNPITCPVESNYLGTYGHKN